MAFCWDCTDPGQFPKNFPSAWKKEALKEFSSKFIFLNPRPFPVPSSLPFVSPLSVSISKCNTCPLGLLSNRS